MCGSSLPKIRPKHCRFDSLRTSYDECNVLCQIMQMSLMPLRRIITDLCFNHTLFALHHVLSCKDKGVQIVDALRDVSFCLNAHLISPH